MTDMECGDSSPLSFFYPRFTAAVFFSAIMDRQKAVMNHRTPY